jgi:RimJ/RimL family protein N-acetyltransferase
MFPVFQKLTPYRLCITFGLTALAAGLVTLLGVWGTNGAIAFACVILYLALGAAQGVLLSSTHPEKHTPWYLPMFLTLLAGLSPVLLGLMLGISPEVWEGWLLRLHHAAVFLLARDRIRAGDLGTFDYVSFFFMPAILVWLGVLIQSKVRGRFEKTKISFRRMAMEDIPMLHGWLNTDHVAKYWKDPASPEDVQVKYGAYITGEKPTEPFIIAINGTDAGYIQTYRNIEYPEYFERIGADPLSAGVDLFIGHPDLLRKGHGAHILRAFIKSHVFADPETSEIVISPEPDNAIAIRVYEKVGFKWYKTVDAGGGEQEFLMRLIRGDFHA